MSKELSTAELDAIVKRVSHLRENPKSVFISYTWDSDEHKRWVRSLADQLIEAGFEVVYDQYENTHWGVLLSYLRACNNIIFVSTETCWERCAPSNEFEGEIQLDGVFFDERQTLNRDIRPSQKVFTLYRSGIHCSNCYPIIDFSQNADYVKAMFVLIIFLINPWRNNNKTFYSPVFIDTQKKWNTYEADEIKYLKLVPLEEYVDANKFSGVKFVRY